VKCLIVGNEFRGIKPLDLLDGIFPDIRWNSRVNPADGGLQSLYKQHIFKVLSFWRVTVRGDGRGVEVLVALFFKELDGKCFYGRFGDFNGHLFCLQSALFLCQNQKDSLYPVEYGTRRIPVQP